MKNTKILVNETHYKLLFESDDHTENSTKIKGLIESGQMDNIEIALMLLDSQGFDKYEFLDSYSELYHFIPNYIMNARSKHNFVDDMLDSFRVMLEITDLNLHKKGIERLPENIGFLKNLKVLDLSRNQLKKIPESIGNLENLKMLGLSNNLLTKLPNSISKLKNLNDAAARNNKFTQLEKQRIATLLPIMDL